MKLIETIKSRVRNLLTEKDNVTYDYSCAMLNIKISDNDWEGIQNIINDDELYDDEESSFGREDAPHITLLYGIHQDVPFEDVKTIVDTFKPVKITLNKVGFFANDKFDVIKYEFNDKTLNSYNKKLVELPHTNSYPDYKAHLTLAYVKSGMGKEISDRFNGIEPTEYECDEIKYSEPDKEKKYIKLTN